ncbi:hypothetical protein BGZ54_010528 [Gamsiella multidivaricata]|nr:hypothetical protein BGZ54_010528 [Gamsiella multidivaricata]
MDLLNAVESVQSSLRVLLEKNCGAQGRPSEHQEREIRVMSLYLLHCLYRYVPIQQNPFLCLFVDIYNLASQDEKLKSERFVTSVILNGKGEELAPKTPSELIALSQKIESRPVNLRMLEEYLPEVPIEEQVKVGLGWDSQQTREDKKRVWEAFTIGSRYGDDEGQPNGHLHHHHPHHHNHHRQQQGATNAASPTTATVEPAKEQDEQEEELEEWEIEAERRFQDSDDDDAPSLPSPASKKATFKPKVLVSAAKTVEQQVVPVETKKVSQALEKAAAMAAAAGQAQEQRQQDPAKRRRKIWSKK